jgi:hypothetical protein
MQSYLSVDFAQQNAGDPHAMTATRHMPCATPVLAIFAKTS